MPEKKTIARAKRDLKQGKSASTAAGEFVREEMEHIRQGKHGARSTEQAIAIGLSKARRSGVPLAAPKPGRTSEQTRRSAERDVEVGEGAPKRRRTSAKRRRASARALKREPRAAASKAALSRHAKAAAPRRRAKSVKRPSSGAARRGSSGASRTRPKATGARRPRQSSTSV